MGPSRNIPWIKKIYALTKLNLLSYFEVVLQLYPGLPAWVQALVAGTFLGNK